MTNDEKLLEALRAYAKQTGISNKKLGEILSLSHVTIGKFLDPKHSGKLREAHRNKIKAYVKDYLDSSLSARIPDELKGIYNSLETIYKEAPLVLESLSIQIKALEKSIRDKKRDKSLYTVESIKELAESINDNHQLVAFINSKDSDIIFYARNMIDGSYTLFKYEIDLDKINHIDDFRTFILTITQNGYSIRKFDFVSTSFDEWEILKKNQCPEGIVDYSWLRKKITKQSKICFVWNDLVKEMKRKKLL